jgi:ABC-2 type transport system ATP-binding protein
VFGFLGPNGAGKSTTIRMLVGLVRPSAGRALVAGHDLGADRDAALGRLGCIVESPDFYGYLTGRENLEHFARMVGRAALARVDELAALVRLAERLDDRVSTYSLGMRQRLGIAQALLGQPDLLVLDEPANGLDPVGMSEMRDLLGRLASEDRTVLVSSHLLSELEQVSDWLLMINDGRLMYAGEASGFATRASTEILLGTAADDELLVLADVVSAAGLVAGRDGDHLVVDANGNDPRALAASLNQAAASAGVVLAELHVRRPSLEANYFRLLEGEHR